MILQCDNCPGMLVICTSGLTKCGLGVDRTSHCRDLKKFAWLGKVSALYFVTFLFFFVLVHFTNSVDILVAVSTDTFTFLSVDCNALATHS